MAAIGRAAEDLGYTNVCLIRDGQPSGYVVGTLPARSGLVEPDEQKT